MARPASNSSHSLLGREEAAEDTDDAAEEETSLLSPCGSDMGGAAFSDEAEVAKRRCAARWPLVVAGVVLLAVLLWTLKRHIGETVMALAHLAKHSGTWGILAVVLALSLWVLIMMPISIFEVLVGHVFPLKTALAVCIVGKTIGACACFAVAGYAKPFVERLMRRHRRLRALSRLVQAHPLKATLLVRFSTLPAPIKNYGWSSLGVSFRVFFVATLAEAPMYALPPVLLGGQLNDLADLAAGKQRIPLNKWQLALGLSMLLLLVVLGATSQRWLEAEQRATEEPADSEVEAQLVLRSPTPLKLRSESKEKLSAEAAC